jgi:hypothetical protein
MTALAPHATAASAPARNGHLFPGAAGAARPTALARSLAGRRSDVGGSTLDPVTRVFMESRFSHDFSRVRVRADASGARSARSLNAAAYTTGQTIVFGEGRYQPLTGAGKGLLAHELAHVVQGATATPRSGTISRPGDELEIAADRAATAVLAGQSARIGPVSAVPEIQRQAHAPVDPREQIITLGESEDAADRQQALDLIIQTYYQPPPAHFESIRYEPDLVSTSPQAAETGPAPGQAAFGGEQRIHIGPPFFRNIRSRFDQRVRTIGHELQHVGQRSPAAQSRRLLGIGAGVLGGALLGAAGLGIAALAGASLGAGLIGGVIGGAAALGGLVGGLTDPFGSTPEPVRNVNTREFLAMHWVVTAEVHGIGQLPRGQALQNINQPGAGALARYAAMPPEDQRRYRRQYQEILDLKRRLEAEAAP